MTAFVIAALLTGAPGAYEANWESIDARPNPQWFEEAKFGIFIHWGLYSVPAWAPKDRYAEWYWAHMENKAEATWQFHEKMYGADFQYQDFAPQFTAQLFDPVQWADIFARSGAKYVVLTSKHHEGFALWPSEQSWNWNSVDIGPHRDLAGDLINAVRERGLRMGFYYSLYEWYHPLYKKDIDQYVDQHMLPQFKDLVVRYKPDIIWPDGEWEHTSDVWRSTEFLAWLFNESPAPKDVVINDRWGKECRNVHGGFATPEYGNIPEGHLIQNGIFEECQGMGHSFGYNRNEDVDSYRSTKSLLHLLIDNVSRGGNLLLDIGPTADGRIPVIMQQRLVEMGEWLAVNGDAIYGTERWEGAPQMEQVRFTSKRDALFAICLEWPGSQLDLPALGELRPAGATLLGHEGALELQPRENGWRITLPQVSPGELPCQHAWVIRLELEK